MRGPAPHHPDVFSHLPALLMRELDTPEVAAVLDELVTAGWRPGQLRHRVGAAPSQGSVERDAVHLLELLRGLRDQPCPDALHAQEVAERASRRRWEADSAPPPSAAPRRRSSPSRRRTGRGRRRRRLGSPP